MAESPNSFADNEEALRGLIHDSEFSYFLVLLELLRYQLHFLRETFGDDLASPLLFCELTMHEIRSVNPDYWGSNDKVAELFVKNTRPRTNIHSLALATRIPPQTARRKINNMIRQGYINRDAAGNLYTSLALHGNSKDQVPSFISEVLRASVQIQSMLQNAANTKPAKSKPHLRSVLRSKNAALGIVLLAAASAVLFALSAPQDVQYGFFRPRLAALDTKIEQESASCVEGMVQDLANLKHEYQIADESGRAALRVVGLYRLAAYDRKAAALPPDLAQFYDSLRR
jgi:hypothetical protein